MSALSFPPPIFKKLHPSEYLRRFTSNGTRPSGRNLDEFRPLSVACSSIKTAAGSAVVRLGDTAIVAGVKLEISYQPAIVPNIDLGPLCSGKFKPGPPNDFAMAMAEKLDALIKTTDLLPPETLVIEPEKAAWVVYVDLMCLNYDGNVFDAAWTALVAALYDTQIPIAKYDQDLQKVVCDGMETVKPRCGKRTFSSSFSLFDNSYLLADPDDDEEELTAQTVHVVVDGQGMLRHTSTGGAITTETLNTCIDLAQARTKELLHMYS